MYFVPTPFTKPFSVILRLIPSSFSLSTCPPGPFFLFPVCSPFYKLSYLCLTWKWAQYIQDPVSSTTVIWIKPVFSQKRTWYKPFAPLCHLESLCFLIEICMGQSVWDTERSRKLASLTQLAKEDVFYGGAPRTTTLASAPGVGVMCIRVWGDYQKNFVEMMGDELRHETLSKYSYGGMKTKKGQRNNRKERS